MSRVGGGRGLIIDKVRYVDVDGGVYDAFGVLFMTYMRD